MDTLPHLNEELVLYMDDLTGTNKVLHSVTNHGTGKSTIGTTPAGTSEPIRGPATGGTMMNENEPKRIKGGRGPEVADLLSKRQADGNDPIDRRANDGNPAFRYPGLRSVFDVNVYQQKKTLAQGMMDLTLLSANANQFRYVLQSPNHPYFVSSVSMIGTSIILQIVVGIGLIWNSKYNVTKDTHCHVADKINNLTVIGIFLVTILNVFITSFSVSEPVENNGVR